MYAQLYTCKPTEVRVGFYAWSYGVRSLNHLYDTYNVYVETAVFHDPVGLAKGLGSIRAQFNGLVKVCPHALWQMHHGLSVSAND